MVPRQASPELEGVLASLSVAPLVKAPGISGTDFLSHWDRDDRSQLSEGPVAKLVRLDPEDLTMMLAPVAPTLDKT